MRAKGQRKGGREEGDVGKVLGKERKDGNKEGNDGKGESMKMSRYISIQEGVSARIRKEGDE